MSLKTSITAFSLPEETEKVLNKLQGKFQRTRSQLLRDMINFYARNYQNETETKSEPSKNYFDSQDTNRILKYYYQLISETKNKPALVIGIVVINKKNRVLIGLRKSKDIYLKNLSWTFPTGKFNSLEFEKEIVKTIKRETGFEAKVEKLIHARLIPDSPEKKVRIIGLYYHCKIISGKQNPGGDFKELKWIPGTEVTRHFTTSVCDEIMNFLGGL